MKKNKERIFVQIASYRDPELIPTIKDCLDNAEHPENLVFAIAWQHSEEDTWDRLDEYENDPKFKIIDMGYKDALGTCFARHVLQQYYDGEEYTLQLDSHHRFTKHWDTECIKILKNLQNKGFPKPLLTSYSSSFEPDNDPNGRIYVPWKMNFDRYLPEGAIFFMPASIDNYMDLTEPIPARFLSAHFIFTLGQFVKDVPYNPEYYFHGEEISLAVRAYTHGYDLFHPHKVLSWHEYTRNNKKKHWDDDPKWVEKNNRAHYLNRKLFGMDGELRDDIGYGKYGFGKERSLEEYEKYAGVCFKDRTVQQYTLNNQNPPNPIYENEEEYKNSFKSFFKHCIDLYSKNFPENDYDFWVVSFEKNDGTVVNRKDADEHEIRSLMSAAKNDGDWIRLWREFFGDIPDKWVVWPHSKSKGWLDRIEEQFKK